MERVLRYLVTLKILTNGRQFTDSQLAKIILLVTKQFFDEQEEY